MPRTLVCACGTCRTCRHRVWSRDWARRRAAGQAPATYRPSTCRYCGAALPTVRGNPRRWCDEACRRSFRAETRPAPTVATAICHSCAAEFTYSPGHGRRPDRCASCRAAELLERAAGILKGANHARVG